MSRPVITPRQHALIDLGFVAARACIALTYWKTKPRVAIGGLIAAAMGTTYWSMTDMPFTPMKVLSYRTHLVIDGIQAPLVAALPALLGFGGKPEARFFYGDALAAAALTALSVAWMAPSSIHSHVITETSMGPAATGPDRAMSTSSDELLDTPSSLDRPGYGGKLRKEMLNLK